ncbi:MAG: hypothetical protein CL623_01985 [Arcobacter sp.]|nr:hypothetical protein [Arcobacter sp.]|tara:strand:- start:8410 stop:8655 length:246 start_codon:yes stop_codon:yes gene_type:complete
MSEIDILITLTGVTMAFAVLSVQGYMFGNLLMGNLLELYDIRIVNRFSNALLVERGYCMSSESCRNVRFELIKQVSNWERG